MSIYYYSAARSGNSLYWMTRDQGLFMKMNIESKDVEVLNPQGMEQIDTKYSSVQAADDQYVYGIIHSGEFFFRYNIRQNTIFISKIELQNKFLDWEIFREIINNNLIVIGECTAGVVKIDIRTGTADVIELAELANTNKSLIKYGMKHKDRIELFDRETNEIISIYFDSYSCSIHKINGLIGKIEGMDYYDGHYWFLDDKGVVYKYNEKDENCEQFTDTLSYSSQKSDFGGLVCTKNLIWILPKYENRFICVDVLSKKVVKTFTYDKDANIRKINHFSRCPSVVRSKDGCVLLGMNGVNEVFVINADEKGYFINVNVEERKVADSLRTKEKIIMNEEDLSLEGFIDYVVK